MENVDERVPSQLIKALLKHKYHLVGKHSGVKKCKWLHEALVNNRHCYKQKFYGIRSHQCLQMTPALYYCTQECVFCWRAQNGDLKVRWNETQLQGWDSPESIVDGCLYAQGRILSGYKGNERTDFGKLRESFTPKHVAISLTGEPTLFEALDELIGVFHKRGLTTFLVTNGTQPSKLSGLGEEPTQLYVSVCAPNENVYNQVCRPHIDGAWFNLMHTLGLLSSFACPTVIRTTLVRGFNLRDVDGYAKLVNKANPTYVEVKAYMHVGFSNLRLGYERMPSHKEVCDFAAELAEKSGYKILDESIDSRVVLLSKRERALRFGSG